MTSTHKCEIFICMISLWQSFGSNPLLTHQGRDTRTTWTDKQRVHLPGGCTSTLSTNGHRFYSRSHNLHRQNELVPFHQVQDQSIRSMPCNSSQLTTEDLRQAWLTYVTLGRESAGQERQPCPSCMSRLEDLQWTAAVPEESTMSSEQVTEAEQQTLNDTFG